MSKNKDIEKLHDKQLEKKLEIKEHAKIEKIEKHEPKEIKEPIKEQPEIKEAPKEKLEVKEGPKEKIEHKEIKEPIKEHKDKDLEKQIFEKGGKELVEGQHPGVDVTNPPVGATTHLGHAGGAAPAAASA